MPLVSIEARRAWEPEQRHAIIAAVLSALREAFRLPEDDGIVRFLQHAPGDFVVRPPATESYLLVQVDLFSGRSASAKRALYQLVVQNLGELGIAPSDVMILLRETDRENWGIRGGIPASDVDLGFRVDV